MKKEIMERICFNCNVFFPASMDGNTEYGICLNDKEFEPFIDELLENFNYSSCQNLVDTKKFSGERNGCEDYEEMEFIEMDNTSGLSNELKRLSETGELDFEALKEWLLYEQVKNINWATMPVDRYVRQLQSPLEKDRNAGISSLGGMISLGNKEAFMELLKYFSKLPPTKTLEEVYLKKEVLRHLVRDDMKSQILPYIINELYNTPSNNTTRQWITAIFEFLSHSPKDKIREPLEKMLKDKRFSYRLKEKMKNILYGNSL
ncbi:hypothetical protein KsCSTR_05800 [Candidatus Kuenenia stuttgartiensis]|jgi:hypothetical protein|uniref:Uncharacterized protein n=1 Tax=Kuenenia stuttgartiensis TaxID=174633 RepID=A0A2C9CF19_KUEST|nr:MULTISPECIES: hypothetical protein [Kuenenia]MBE7546581.1 hypothetical protein [Planctomycetia bacterium]MBZ0190841.1 hypothetical protein [Candidatus Kuenenia stuttgartiensis]MCF6151274.1 hypothetical protein [Candidatus Kuenenia stuttgartiensis]MCL4726173.1 hypothetical protein [Candidatus Kuenenia stuttgartiensis]MCZ7621800.1 hypothetical protein [Candidatus Kuenenia sp.]